MDILISDYFHYYVICYKQTLLYVLNGIFFRHYFQLLIRFLILFLTAYLKSMQDQLFNFCEEEIDQKTKVGVVPISTHQSLAGSRIIYHFTQQQQDCSEIDFQHQNTVRERGEDKSWRNKKQARMREIQTGEELKINKQCTFKPKTNANKSRRDFKQFLETQQAYSKKVKEKIDQLRKNKQNLENQPKVQPKKRQKILKNKTQQSVFERLVTQKQKYHCNLYNKLNQITFQPSISEKSKNMIRQEPVVQFLYKDAKNRQEKYNSQNKMRGEEQSCEKTTNSKSQQYIGRKFLKQFGNIIEGLEITSLFQQNVEKIRFVQILNKLGFITMSSIQYLPPNQLDLVNAAYDYISKIYPSAFNIFTFLLAVIGVAQIDPFKILELDSESIDEFSQILLCLNQNEAKSLHMKYQLLYRNRLYSQQKIYNITSPDSCTFSPHISSQSQYLASKHRRIMLEVASKYLPFENSPNESRGKTITHPQFLIMNKKIKEIELSRQRSTEEKKKLKQCTFMPKLNSKVDKSLKKCPDTNNPMIVLDVNFGSKQEQIILKPQYCNFLPEIAKFYADKHYIDEESETKLLQLLREEFRVFSNYIDSSI